MADPFSKEVVTQMKEFVTDQYLQGEAEMFTKRMEIGTMANEKPQDHSKTIAKQAEAVESFITNPRLHEHATRLAKQVEVMTASQKFQDQATRIAQLIETLIADA